MLRYIFGAVILVASVPTVGYLANGLVCFVMGAANVPGYTLWFNGVQQHNKIAQMLGIIFGWLGQSVVSLFYAFVLVQLVYLFFGNFQIAAIFRWLYWAAVFCFLALGPAHRTLTISMLQDSGRVFYKYTLSLTLLTTAVGFFVFGLAHVGSH